MLRRAMHGGRKTHVTGERRKIEVVETGERRGRRRRVLRDGRHARGRRLLHGGQRETVIEGGRRWSRRRGGTRGHRRGLSTGAECPYPHHRLFHFRPIARGITRGYWRRCTLRRIGDEKRMPALWASHLEAGRRNAALVDLIRSLAGLALDLEHALRRLPQRRNPPRKPGDTLDRSFPSPSPPPPPQAPKAGRAPLSRGTARARLHGGRRPDVRVDEFLREARQRVGRRG